MKRWLPVAGVLLVVGLLSASCGGTSGGSASTAPSAGASGAATSGDVVKYGLITGITGSASAAAPLSKAGADIAISEINDAGGVLGKTAQLEVADDKSTVEGAVQAFSFVTDVKKVDVLLITQSDSTLALLKRFQAKQLPTVGPSNGTSELDKAGGPSGFYWRFTASDTDLGTITAQFARDFGWKKMSMLVQNTEGAASPADQFAKIYKEKVGGQLLADVRLDPGQADYATQVDQAFSGNPNAVYLSTSFESGGIILKEWQRRGYGGVWSFSPDMIMPEIQALASQGVELNGNLHSANNTLDIKSPAYESYAPKYEAKMHMTTLEGSKDDATTFDATIALALAMTKANSITDGPAIAAAMQDICNPPGKVVYSYADGVAALKAGEDIDYSGVTGSDDMNEWGNLLKPLFADIQMINGKFTPGEVIAMDPTLAE